MSAYFAISVLLLAILLFFPITRMVWVLSVRRLQRREHRELSESETRGQLKRARFLAGIVALVFSYLFNLSIGGTLGYA